MVFPTTYSMPVAELAVALEERGFESLWLPEHSHIPVSRESPWPGGDTLPRHYHDAFDPLIALTAAAAVTTRLRLATGVLILPQRDPLQVAKEIATLDVLSGGRVDVGVGAGWNLEEMRNHGADPAHRFRSMRERAEAMKAIWTQDEAAYHGRIVDFDPVWAWPKPVQPGGPPIHVGGAAPNGIRRAVAWADGWMPLAGRGDSDFPTHAATLRAMAEEAGRDPATVQMTVVQAPTDPAELEAYAAAGITRVVFGLPSRGADDVLPRLDKLAPLVDRVAA